MISNMIRFNWTFFKKWFFTTIFLFVLLFLLSFPFPQAILPNIGAWCSPFFEFFVEWSANHIFKIKTPFTVQIMSDSMGLYIHTFNLLLFSLVIGGISALFQKNQINPQLKYLFHTIIRYYLAMQLLAYGWSKVFKWQFYLPEPNILYTPLGKISPDLLYWSTMGVSRSYTMFGGFAEVLVAFLLLFKKTRLLGALIGIGIMTNVVMINFSYDISVKFYSSFLLFLLIILVFSDAKRLFSFFILNKNTPSNTLWRPNWRGNQIRWYRTIKTVVIGILLINSLEMYLSTRNFNDDKAARPSFHGAYEVTQFAINGRIIPPSLDFTHRWRRFFVHRLDYFIIQNMKDEMLDYKLTRKSENQFIITDTREPDKTMTAAFLLEGETTFFTAYNNKDTIEIEAIKLELEQH